MLKSKLIVNMTRFRVLQRASPRVYALYWVCIIFKWFINREMRERIVAFDYLRALAITGILLCHFCHNYNSISFLGHYFGGVFVTLFIAMSGMLFGIVWNNNSRMEYDMSFLKQRFFKLSVTYYPFLILMFAFLYFVDDYHFNVKNLFLINMFHFCFFISFEIYLMFEVVSEGRYSLMRIIDNPFLLL